MDSGVVGFTLYLFIALCFAQSDEKDAKMRFYSSSFEDYEELPLSSSHEIINSSWYNATRNTVVFCHGFSGFPNGPAVQGVIKTYLGQGESNVALLNWEHLAANSLSSIPNSYINWAAPNARKLGVRFAETVGNLSAVGVDLTKLYLIGHSLGAHVFGIAGNNLRLNGILLPWIIGLDPAALGFENKAPILRLNPGSAKVVTVVHSDPSKYGSRVQLGTVDFWPNFRSLGPVRQPGCQGRTAPVFSPADLCNHHRSWELFIDAIKHPETIVGSHARNFKIWKRYTTEQRAETKLSLETLNNNMKPGNYYLVTNAEPPFGLGVNECLAVSIERIDVPSAVELGTESIVLDCQYKTSSPRPAGLVMKWFFNGSSGLIYQWIPPLRPQVIGLLKGKVDMNFRISDEPLQAYRAIKVLKPSTDLSGNYTCVVSTFIYEDRQTRSMVVYSPAKTFRFIQDKKYVFLVTLICFAQDLYPKPNISILSQGEPLQQAVLESKMNSWGLYTVALTAVVHDDDILTPFEEFVCLLSLPLTNYTKNLTTVYYPGLMPTAYISAYEVQRPQHHQANGLFKHTICTPSSRQLEIT
ncbi:unnamed protein product [Leptosia nina]|uniref:Ig-like domain-containing protein n=1 Tax=Leptosia nina TaxID=320188 RepID=A0AAV1IX76_9NEOP